MKQSIQIAFVLMAVLSFACEKENHAPQPFELGDSFELSLEAPTADCACGTMTISYAEVVEDSRCPAFSMCIWEGRAVVEFDLLLNGDNQKLTLISRSGQENLARDTIGNYIFTLENVAPYPQSPDDIQEKDYRFTLNVTNL
jgi:hypothetical protein